MKIKKLFALALAGVMAVSMLAGCSVGLKKDGEVTAAAVIDSLSEDTTEMVSFKENIVLQASLRKAADVDKGEAAKSAEDVAAAIADGNTNLTTTPLASSWEILNAFEFPADKTFVAVVAMENPDDTYTTSHVIKELAAKIEKVKVCKGKTIAEMPVKNNGSITLDDEKCHYDLTYTGNIAVVTVGNTSYAAFTVTRTAKLVMD